MARCRKPRHTPHAQDHMEGSHSTHCLLSNLRKPILSASPLRRPPDMLWLILVIDSRVKRWIPCNLFNLTGQSPIVICSGAFFGLCTILLAWTITHLLVGDKAWWWQTDKSFLFLLSEMELPGQIASGNQLCHKIASRAQRLQSSKNEKERSLYNAR